MTHDDSAEGDLLVVTICVAVFLFFLAPEMGAALVAYFKGVL